MLKRINIHVEDKQLEDLDKLAKQIGQHLVQIGHYSDPSRADLIRFAISRTYGMDYHFIHLSKEALWEAIRKVRNNLLT